MSFESASFAPEHEAPANAHQSETAGTVDLPLGEGFSLPTLLENVARYYLERAIEQADGNKTKAARLVGLPSYQTFTNWAARYKAQRGNRRAGSRPNADVFGIMRQRSTKHMHAETPCSSSWNRPSEIELER